MAFKQLAENHPNVSSAVIFEWEETFVVTIICD